MNEQTYYSPRRLHLAFAAAATALLAVTVWALLVDHRRGWKRYQEAAEQVNGERAGEATPHRSPTVRQIVLPALSIDFRHARTTRIDRCTTCHTGIDRTDDDSLAQPFCGHPRPELFVAETSPHPMSRFGCTICHEGQGSATDFAWAAHSPNSVEQQTQWQREYGWFDNRDWDRPMLPKRLVEASCLKCHHEVTDLESTARHPDPPAGKLLSGYHLVRQFGCFSCHEIQGHDETGQSLGPDMRLEPGDTAARQSSTSPGTLRKVGPSLRHLPGKVDAAYIESRLVNPSNFLPKTRMPRIYGVHSHLDGATLETAELLEAEEIRSIAAYLLSTGERQTPLSTPIVAQPSAALGKTALAVKGCLACHTHREFPQAEADIGPDLSNVGSKYVGESGRQWLLDWLRDPTRYSPQTRMPKSFFEPAGVATATDPPSSDPAADIAEFLFESSSKPSWQSAGTVNDKSSREALVTNGRAAIARRGCYACHDIPGFTDSPRIGPALSDWGRKRTSLLGFDRVDEFVARSNAGESEPTPAAEFFVESLRARRREGFLWQKLTAPRSFDFHMAQEKPYGEWLTMGQFKLTEAEREAIMTFVLGLVAEPPAEPYVFRPGPTERAIAVGRKILDKYACGECHTLEMEHWRVRTKVGQMQEIVGMPRLDAAGRVVEDEDDDGKPLCYFTLWEPAVVGDKKWAVGEADVPIPKAQVLAKRPPWGGRFARLLYPIALERAKSGGATSQESTAWGWGPPPLMGEGKKVRPEWLGEFLLRPTPIRPAAMLRMPQFTLTSAEAARLVEFFQAAAGVHPGDQWQPSQGQSQPPGQGRGAEAETRLKRLDEAVQLIHDSKTYCAKCHVFGDLRPSESTATTLAPDLEVAGQRLQADYVHRWLKDPKSILPYTPMPVNFPASGPLSQSILPGTSAEQLDATLELLRHYDWYLRKPATPKSPNSPQP